MKSDPGWVKCNRGRLSNEDGVTLLEIMVYMVLSGMLLGAAVMTFMGQNRTYNQQDIIAETQQNLRGTIQMMVPEIRLAGLDPEGKGASLLSATQNALSFEYWMDSNYDGSYESFREIVYSLDASDGDLERNVKTSKTSAGQTRTVAENIQQLSFEYLYWNYNTDTWVWAGNDDAIKDTLDISIDKAREQIRAVKINITGIARESAFGDEDSDFNKRSTSVVVQCRNNRG